MKHKNKDLSPVKQRSKKISCSVRAGLTFPVGRVQRFLRTGNYARRIGRDSSIFLTAALEYLVAEILLSARDAADDNNRSRISPRHILLAIRHDEDFKDMLHDVTISKGGVMPYIITQLLPKKTQKNKNNDSDLQSSSNDNNISSQEY